MDGQRVLPYTSSEFKSELTRCGPLLRGTPIDDSIPATIIQGVAQSQITLGKSVKPLPARTRPTTTPTNAQVSVQGQALPKMSQH